MLQDNKCKLKAVMEGVLTVTEPNGTTINYPIRAERPVTDEEIRKHHGDNPDSSD